MCQKTDAADVAERKKAVYNAVMIRRRIEIAFCFQSSVSKFSQGRERSEQKILLHTDKLKRYTGEHLLI